MAFEEQVTVPGDANTYAISPNIKNMHSQTQASLISPMGPMSWNGR
ncbi:Uncharacterised protein [Weissella viridescens]|uniref:Uncharacterized protein n=1 Tax=Weissella viridescens TaxID=1629 RepID=A0A380P8W0_WEIVI|nr:Uncharacterised protein [Weissella viridescens]